MKNMIIAVQLALLLSGVLFAEKNFVTVYNNNLGLIKQVREIKIDDPAHPIKFTDVAAQIIPTSVHLKSLSPGKSFSIAEQNYEYDLVNAEKLLQRYIDKKIEIITDTGELISGKLLSKSGSSFVIQDDAGVKILKWDDKYRVNVPNLPDGLITRPTLIWKLNGAKKGKSDVEVSYLTGGMGWHAEYVAVLAPDGRELNLESWVSVDNNSGATFENAKLKLVAGDVQRAPVAPYLQKRGGAMIEYDMAMSAPVEEREFFDYHIYEVSEPTTLKNYQIKQISMFPAADVKSEKKYVYDSHKNQNKISVNIDFKNSKSAGLGLPLPAGVFRIYQKDRENLEFIGENRIDHTGRNENVSLEIGRAFDLAAERKIVKTEKLSKNSRRESIEIELRNNKEKESVNIQVVEHLAGANWKIESSSHEYKNKDSNTILFNIPVNADKSMKLEYTITYTW